MNLKPIFISLLLCIPMWIMAQQTAPKSTMGDFSDVYLPLIFKNHAEANRVMRYAFEQEDNNYLKISAAFAGLCLNTKSGAIYPFLFDLIQAYGSNIPDSFPEKQGYLNYGRFHYSSKNQAYDSAYNYLLNAKSWFESTSNIEMQIECSIELIQTEIILSSVFNPHWNTRIEKLKALLNAKNDIQFVRILRLEGDLLFFQNKIAPAISKYSEAVKATPPQQFLLLSNLFNDLAVVSFPLGNKEEYKNYLEQSIKNAFLADDSLDAAPALINLAKFYFDFGNRTKALEIAHLAEKIVDENTDLFLRRDVYIKLFYFHQQMGNYKLALDYSEAARIYTDSITELRDQNYISKLNAQYNFEQMLKENRWLNEESNLKSKQRNLFMAISIILFVVVSMIVYIFYQRDKNQEALQAEKEKIYRQNVTEILKAQEIKSMNALFEGQQTERKRIAEELHDRLCGMLATIKLHVSALESKLSDKKVKKLQQILQYEHAIQLIDHAYDEVRKISHNLSSGTLINFGLLPALKDLKENLNEGANFSITFRSFGLEGFRLDSLIEIHVFRAIQELITNVIKHAGATAIQIDLNLIENNLNIIFSDNGRGFDPALKSSGRGLKNVNSRIERLNGDLTIDSNKGNGTTFIINIPVT
ncbi:MAG: sensor histidine kinase [Bacteroidota bacterium]|nr:sensor histidine kinase [Bacteroidota bacterium]